MWFCIDYFFEFDESSVSHSVSPHVVVRGLVVGATSYPILPHFLIYPRAYQTWMCLRILQEILNIGAKRSPVAPNCLAAAAGATPALVVSHRVYAEDICRDSIFDSGFLVSGPPCVNSCSSLCDGCRSYWGR